MKPSGVQLTRPIRPPAAGHPHQLVGGGPVERREHHADARRRHVERAVGVGQRLGVPLLPRDVEALGRRHPLADGEQLGCQVGCRDPRSRPRRRDGHGAGARGDVEEPVARCDAARLDEHVAERGDDLGGDGRVVAQGPHRAVLLLHLGGGAVAHGLVGPALLGGVGHGGLLRGGAGSQRRGAGRGRLQCAFCTAGGSRSVLARSRRLVCTGWHGVGARRGPAGGGDHVDATASSARSRRRWRCSTSAGPCSSCVSCCSGSRHFNELRRGNPKMSPALLSKRLRRLERAGVVRRRVVGGRSTYELTESGLELRGIVDALGAWGARWVGELGEEDLDPHLLMWDVKRTIPVEDWPRGRTVVAIRFADVAAAGLALVGLRRRRRGRHLRRRPGVRRDGDGAHLAARDDRDLARRPRVGRRAAGRARGGGGAAGGGPGRAGAGSASRCWRRCRGPRETASAGRGPVGGRP